MFKFFLSAFVLLGLSLASVHSLQATILTKAPDSSENQDAQSRVLAKKAADSWSQDDENHVK